MFPKHATLSSTHRVLIMSSETTQKNKLIFPSKEQPFKDMKTMITFSLQGFQYWLLQPLFKEQDFKAPLHLASFTHALVCPCGPYSAQPRLAAAYHWYHSQSIQDYSVFFSSIFLYSSYASLGASPFFRHYIIPCWEAPWSTPFFAGEERQRLGERQVALPVLVLGFKVLR